MPRETFAQRKLQAVKLKHEQVSALPVQQQAQKGI
jgi:hypothetical protein